MSDLIFRQLQISYEVIPDADEPIECLHYICSDSLNHKTTKGLISLDKKWFMPGRNSRYIGQWVKLKTYIIDNEVNYGYEDPSDTDNKPWMIYEEIIAMVDEINDEIVEREVLGHNPETRMK